MGKRGSRDRAVGHNALMTAVPTAPRQHEYPMPPGITALQALRDVLMGSSLAAFIVLFLVLAIMLPVETGVFDGAEWLDIDAVDRRSRAAMVSPLVVGFGGLSVMFVVRALHGRFERKHLLRIFAEAAQPELLVPIRRQRASLSRESSTGLAVLGFFGVVVGPIVAISVFAGSVRDFWYPLPIGVLMTVVGVLFLRSQLNAAPLSHQMQHDLDRAWGKQAVENLRRLAEEQELELPSVDDEYPRGRRVWRAVGSVGMAAGSFLLGAWGIGATIIAPIVQPCQDCDPLDFSGDLENLGTMLGLILTLLGTAAVLGAVLTLVGGVGIAMATWQEERTLRRIIAEGREGQVRPSAQELEVHAGDRPMLLQTGQVVLGLGVLISTLGFAVRFDTVEMALVEEPPLWWLNTLLVGIVIMLAGAAVIAVARFVFAVRANTIRHAWPLPELDDDDEDDGGHGA